MTPESHVPIGVLFGLLFTLAGPIKMIPIFSKVAGSLPSRQRASLAAKSAAFGLVGISLAALMGAAQVQKVGISPEALVTSAGLVLSMIGLVPLVGWNSEPNAQQAEPPDALAFAFQTLLPPYAFGLIIIFSLYTLSFGETLQIIMAGAALMLINLLAMLASGWVMSLIGVTPLRIFGAVFGIIQLALGIQMLFWGVRHGLLGAS